MGGNLGNPDRENLRLRRSGKEYSAIFDQFMDKLAELGLERGDIPTRSQASLEQALLSRKEEEAGLIEQAGAQMERLKLLEAMEKDPRRVRPPLTSRPGPPLLPTSQRVQDFQPLAQGPPTLCPPITMAKAEVPFPTTTSTRLISSPEELVERWSKWQRTRRRWRAPC